MDGAHTHHHGPAGPGIGTALLVGIGLALGAQAARAVAAIIPALLAALAVAAGLALAALTACAVIGSRRRRHAFWDQPAPGSLPPGGDALLAGDREVVTLRQAITELHAQLYATRAALDAAPRPDAHQHLHFHGLDPDQVAAILAVHRRQAGDGQ